MPRCSSGLMRMALILAGNGAVADAALRETEAF
jgi:hypothetical protein